MRRMACFEVDMRIGLVEKRQRGRDISLMAPARRAWLPVIVSQLSSQM